MDRKGPGRPANAWRSLPVEHWPSRHRQKWEQAIARGSLVRNRGPASTLSRATRVKICQIYGVILAWADREGRLDWNGAPSTFMSIELLVDFITERRRSVSDATTFGNVRDLAMIMKFLSGEDTRWIRGCVAGPTRAEARAARVLKPLFAAGPFLDKIVVALDEAMNWPLTETTDLRVRDLLLAGFGISSPIRFRNLWELRVGHDLIRRKTAWEILLEEYEVKNRLTVQHTIPSILTPFADRYVAVDRPRLLRANRADRMWISSEARWMSQASVRHS